MLIEFFSHEQQQQQHHNEKPFQNLFWKHLVLVIKMCAFTKWMKLSRKPAAFNWMHHILDLIMCMFVRAHVFRCVFTFCAEIKWIACKTTIACSSKTHHYSDEMSSHLTRLFYKHIVNAFCLTFFCSLACFVFFLCFQLFCVCVCVVCFDENEVLFNDCCTRPNTSHITDLHQLTWQRTQKRNKCHHTSSKLVQGLCVD